MNPPSALRIGLVGDRHEAVRAHHAIPIALRLTGYDVEPVWIATEEIRTEDLSEWRLDALWCIPGSPYQSMDGALAAIRWARERGLPFLGSCGGFQHALLEYARHVLGIYEADHAESNPDAALTLITPLSCSMVGRQGVVQFLKGTKSWAICGDERVASYHCNYGLNSAHAAIFSGSPLQLAGLDLEDEWRVVELSDHPFFIACLFQPELEALDGFLHPLIRAFVAAAALRPSR